MRRPIIAGNWKMNNTKAQTYALLNDLIPLVKDAEAEVVICVPYTSIWAAGEAIKGTNIHLGAENVHWAEKGAFTGEISADMLKEQGVEYVIIGHSERRQYFGETDQTVNMRVKAALAHGLKPIICVGETLEEREGGKVEEVLTRVNLKTLSSPTNPYGQSARARLLPRRTPTTPSPSYAIPWQNSTARSARKKKCAYSTAVP